MKVWRHVVVGLFCLSIVATALVSLPDRGGHGSLEDLADTRSAEVSGEFDLTADELAAWEQATSTEAGRAEVVAGLEEAFGDIAQVGVESTDETVQHSSVGDLSPVVAYGVSGSHFWVTASYADMVRGAITAAIAACKRWYPEFGWLCTGVGSLLKRLASGWGSSSRHGVWGEVYWAPPHFRGGRW